MPDAFECEDAPAHERLETALPNAIETAEKNARAVKTGCEPCDRILRSQAMCEIVFTSLGPISANGWCFRTEAGNQQKPPALLQVEQELPFRAGCIYNRRVPLPAGPQWVFALKGRGQGGGGLWELLQNSTERLQGTVKTVGGGYWWLEMQFGLVLGCGSAFGAESGPECWEGRDLKTPSYIPL